VYEFSVPDYPLILNKLGETGDLQKLEDALISYLEGKPEENQNGNNH